MNKTIGTVPPMGKHTVKWKCPHCNTTITTHIDPKYMQTPTCTNHGRKTVKMEAK